MEKAADKIVEETWGEKKPKPEKKEGGPQSILNRSLRFASLRIGPTEALAQEADINVTTPAIRALKDSIKDRSEAIKPYMDSGNVGIANDGYLIVRTTDGLSLRDKANLTRLIEAENRDRETLYREIAKANNFGPERVNDIREIFAKSWVKNARRGWWVQGPDGKWSQVQ